MHLCSKESGKLRMSKSLHDLYKYKHSAPGFTAKIRKQSVEETWRNIVRRQLEPLKNLQTFDLEAPAHAPSANPRWSLTPARDNSPLFFSYTVILCSNLRFNLCTTIHLALDHLDSATWNSSLSGGWDHHTAVLLCAELSFAALFYWQVLGL